MMLRIGIDLDNTIIFYDDAFVSAAKERGFVPASFKGTKQQVRDHIRTLADGEKKWMELQGYIYGRGISHASLFEGVLPFVERALEEGHELFIVSHKTEFGHFDATKTDLRLAAISLLEEQGLFTRGFERKNISFHPTREEKVTKIAELALDHFIDDLVEVYEEPHFPARTQKILFHTSEPSCDHWHTCRNWQEISRHLLK